MRPDIIEVTRAEITAAGISGVTGRMPAKAEAVRHWPVFLPPCGSIRRTMR